MGMGRKKVRLLPGVRFQRAPRALSGSRHDKTVLYLQENAHKNQRGLKILLKYVKNCSSNSSPMALVLENGRLGIQIDRNLKSPAFDNRPHPTATKDVLIFPFCCLLWMYACLRSFSKEVGMGD